LQNDASIFHITLQQDVCTLFQFYKLYKAAIRITKLTHFALQQLSFRASSKRYIIAWETGLVEDERVSEGSKLSEF